MGFSLTRFTPPNEAGVGFAGDATAGRGIARAIFSYAAEGAHYFRCDTHEDNRPMRHALAAFGFRECGTITVVNGTTRIAYDWLAEDVRD